ncbi:proteasome assembly chaperone family protein [Halorubellus sp. JP-L1]|uniref:proteasome assembly chaperone family protein n=1 Tax=Halorubellus sp. JP-L1 TaxID=2715753 RepID=UPI00140E4125|nr:PAC2 family protein [Halorubellus sp. JP-L1]NHN40633.1 proteasome assembly chaperone family protein [Halorubellus sp. JP-L1]
MTTDDTEAFSVCDEGADVNHVVAGFATFGLAGLTAVDYLRERLDLEPCGYVTTDALPAITPFENGRPHHHTRILSRPDLDVAVLHGGLFVPPNAANDFSRAILDWTGRKDVDEVAVLSGVPVAHGPDDHRTFHVATTDYHEARLADLDPAVPPMANGYLDGVNASLVERGMRTDLAVGVFVTPVHDRVPDADAAIRLVDTITSVYDLDVDTSALEEFAADVEAYYARLHERLEELPEEDRVEDRMFM